MSLAAAVVGQRPQPDLWRERWRDIRLKGLYRWTDCLSSYRSSPDPYVSYRPRAWIRNERTGGEALRSQDVFEQGPDYLGDGSYDWGSTLSHWR